MPRYQVIEIRAYYEGLLIDADDLDAAADLRGKIVINDRSESWALGSHSVAEVADDATWIEMP